LNAIGRFYSAPAEAAFLAESEALSAMFDRLEAELAAGRAGPWFAGERFSLVDAVYGPVFRYFDAFDRIGAFGILSGKPRVGAWRKRLHERKSVKDAVTPDYPQRIDHGSSHHRGKDVWRRRDCCHRRHQPVADERHHGRIDW
ncbi:MAG: glutathione S-transferase domain-containing protein, partial [Mesorhizobium sp.]